VTKAAARDFSGRKILAIAAFVLAFAGAANADIIVTFTVSGSFEPYSWYFDPSSTVTIDTTTGTVLDSYLAVDNTPNGVSGTPFTGAPTNISAEDGPCEAGYPATCWSEYDAGWVMGNNRVIFAWQATSSDGLADPPFSIIGFTGGSIADGYAYIGPPYDNWGSTATFTPTTPEPSSVLCSALGLLGLLALAVRSKRLTSSASF